LNHWLVVVVALVVSPAFAGTVVIRKATFPGGGTGFTFNESITAGSFNLSDGGTQTFSSVPAGIYTVTEIPAASWTLADLSCDDADSTVDIASATATVNLGATETVTCTFRNLETAPTDQLFIFHLSGDQEVPPVPTSQRGGCMGRLDAGASELAIVCTHEVAAPTMMHIHEGAAGVDGPIVFDFGNPASPMVATWSGMTPADVANLAAGNLYVNIHTSAYPNGFIRGQILPRTVDSVSFALNGTNVVPPTSDPSTGNCTENLDLSATLLNVDCTHNLPSPDSARLHDAPAGANGPIVFTFASPAAPFSQNVPMTPRWIADFAAGFLYVEVQSTPIPANPLPFIRGQADVAGSDVTITKTAPAAAIAGTNVSYTVTASNAGPLDAASVTVTDTLPAGTTFISATQTAGPSLTCTTPATDSVVCSGGPFGMGATASFTIVVATSPSATLPITNNASIAASPEDPDLADNLASATTALMAPTDLAIAKTAGAGPFVAAGAAHYTITVTNIGANPAVAATVTDVLPAGMTLVSATPSQGSCSGTTTVVCALGTINASASATISLNVTLPAAAGPVSNTATLSSSNDTNPANDSSTAPIAVLAAGAIPALSPIALALLAMTLAALAWMRGV
jgi:uncharacterized repeat protein (TIGR01451 family)